MEEMHFGPCTPKGLKLIYVKKQQIDADLDNARSKKSKKLASESGLKWRDRFPPLTQGGVFGRTVPLIRYCSILPPVRLNISTHYLLIIT